MYTSYYGFKEKPFQITPDPSLFFMSRGHADICSHLEYALMADRGFVAVTGESGSGKTSLINFLIKKHGAPFNIGVLVPNNVRPEPFITKIGRTFGLAPNGHNTADMLRTVRTFLAQGQNNGHRTVIIVDEADTLSDADFEQIRILANLKMDRRHLAQFILVGRPDLKKKLHENRLRDFVQRTTVTCHLGGLERDEVAPYIRHRLRYAGGSQNLVLFDQEAIESIYEHSRGIPKLANIISEAALIYGYADELKTIGKKVIDEVAQDAGTKRNVSEGAHHRLPSPLVEAGTVDWRMMRDTRSDIEKQIHILENRIRLFNQALHNRNSATTNRDEVASELTHIIKRTDRQLTLLLENIKSFLS